MYHFYIYASHHKYVYVREKWGHFESIRASDFPQSRKSRGIRDLKRNPWNYKINFFWMSVSQYVLSFLLSTHSVDCAVSLLLPIHRVNSALALIRKINTLTGSASVHHIVMASLPGITCGLQERPLAKSYKTVCSHGLSRNSGTDGWWSPLSCIKSQSVPEKRFTLWLE